MVSEQEEAKVGDRVADDRVSSRSYSYSLIMADLPTSYVMPVIAKLPILVVHARYMYMQ